MNYPSQPELHIGKIVKISIGSSKNNVDKRLYCDVELDDGVFRNNVPFYGGTIDPDTKKPHGLFFPPVEGAMVGVFFVNAHALNPVVAFPIPFDWGQEENVSDFYDILEDIQDNLIAHRTGSYIKQKKDGSLEIKVCDDSQTEKITIEYKNDGSYKIENDNGFFELKEDGQFNVNDQFTVDP